MLTLLSSPRARAEPGLGGAGQEEHAVSRCLARLDREPKVSDLQRAAVRESMVRPELVESWQRRIRAAALVPAIRVEVGRGGTDLRSTVALDGSEKITLGNGDNWRFTIAASWSLDRLVFDRDEPRLWREVQRLAHHRELLMGEVARIYYQRRRLQVALAVDPPATAAAAVERQLSIDELGAILDGFTGGALGGAAARGSHGATPGGP